MTADTHSQLPSFICVGGAKCGTTSLYEYLRSHPEVFLTEQKELHYFSYPDLEKRPEGPGMRAVLKGLISTEDQYRAQFSSMKPGAVAGDISPSYLNEEHAPERIEALLGKDVKIIILLRDPVERVISQYMHLRRAAREALPLKDALAEEPNRIDKNWGDMWHYRASAYAADRVERYINRFGAENVLVVLSDDLRTHPKETVQDICRFIGVSADYHFDTGQEFNRSGLPKSRFVARLVDASPLANMAKAILPRRLGAIIKRKLQEMNTGEKEAISETLRAQLKQDYANEIVRLEEILGRKTGWQ
ncbi:sulfotransferase family protein [Celeribacter baekdonensis]|uniref:sulfotransferase family protein n=1 Tax=Pseudomonadota TaxID=1224 RepID=UPI003A8E38DB